MNISRHVIEPGFNVETRYNPERASVMVTIREEGDGSQTIRAEGQEKGDRGITIVVPRSAFREAAVSEGGEPIPVLLDAYGIWNAANPNLDYFMDWIGKMDLHVLNRVRNAVDEREQAIMEESTDLS